jgi:hypothetical protein
MVQTTCESGRRRGKAVAARWRVTGGAGHFLESDSTRSRGAAGNGCLRVCVASAQESHDERADWPLLWPIGRRGGWGVAPVASWVLHGEWSRPACKRLKSNRAPCVHQEILGRMRLRLQAASRERCLLQ